MADSTSAKKAKGPSLKLNYLLNLLIQALTILTPLITAPFLARVLHEDGTGMVAYAQSILSMFLLFANLGFDFYGQREIAKSRDDKVARSKTFWELFLLRGAATLLVSAVYVPMLLSNALGGVPTLLWIFGIQLIANIFDITFFFKGLEDFKSIALRSFVIKVGGLICVFAFVRQESDTWIYALSIVGSTVGSNLIMWPSLIGKLTKVRKGTLEFKKHFAPTIRIFLPTLAVTVYSVMDKLEVGWFSSNPNYEVGCYEQAYKINAAALMLVTFISPVLAPRVSHDFKFGGSPAIARHLSQALRYVWMIGTPLFAGFVVMAGDFSALFLGPGFDKVPVLLQVMAVRFLVSGMGEILGSVLFVSIGKEKYCAVISIICAVVDFGINIPFVMLWDSIGAAITTAIVEVISFTGLFIFALRGKHLSFRQFFHKTWHYIVAAALMCAVLVPMHLFLPTEWWSFLTAVLAGSIVYGLTLLVLKDEMLLLFADVVFRKVFRKSILRKAEAQGAAISDGSEPTADNENDSQD